MSNPRQNSEEKIPKPKQMRLMEAASQLHRTINPPRDPSVLSQSSSAYLERQQQELKTTDQAIVQVIMEDVAKADEAKTKEEKSDTSDALTIHQKNGIKIPTLDEALATSNSQAAFFRGTQVVLLCNVAPLIGPDAKICNALIQVSRRSHALFQGNLTEIRMQRLKQLLQHVAYGEKDQAEKIIQSDPRLLLLSGPIVEDYSGRKIQQTAYQMALAAGDVYVRFKNGKYIEEKGEEMAEMIDRYLRQLPNGELEIQRQQNELFPEGYAEQEAKKNAENVEALKKVFKALHEAKANDEKSLLVECKDALEEFREYLKPKGIITTGKHFNPQMLANVYQLYDDYYDHFGGGDSRPKTLVAWRKVIGYVQRFLTACDAMALCQGTYYIVEDGEKSDRSLKFRCGGGTYYPLDSDPNWLLGTNCAVPWGVATPAGLGGRAARHARGLVVWKSYVEQKQHRVALMRSRPDIQSKKSCSIM